MATLGVTALSAAPRWLHWLWAAGCVAVVLAGNVLGARALGRSRRDALRAAALEMRVDLVERAASLEATLRSTRGDLEFLASSPAVSEAPAALGSPDPVTVRFRRLAAEGSFLQYLTAHAGLERLLVRDASGRALVAVGRRASFPVPIPLEAAARDVAPDRLRFVLTLDGGGGELVADVNPASLLSSLAAGTGRAVLLDARGVPLAGTPEAFSRVQRAGLTGHPRGIAPGDPAPPGWAWALVAVAPASFEPPVRWWLARAEREQDLFAGLGSLTAGYRAALVLNVLAVVSTVLLGVALVHLAQRRARLEEAAAHGARQRALEARLAEVDRLAAVGRVAATLAHEVRNPLEGMRNWLALVEDEARAAGADGVLPHAARVREGIDHLGEVVRRVLALARPSAGHRDPLDLDALVRETVADVATWKPFRAVRIDCSLHGSLPAVRGDRVLLGQALLNLLLNARDASPEGAKVEVATAVDGREVVLRVRDHGPGIAPEVRSRLFQPFASAKGSTGLGLALCDRVARAHGGRVEAGDAVDGGAAFALRLPIEGTVIPAVDEEAP